MKISNDNNWENLEMVEFKKIEKFWKFIKESNKILKRQWLEEMEDWTKKKMVEEDEMLNKVKNKK